MVSTLSGTGPFIRRVLYLTTLSKKEIGEIQTAVCQHLHMSMGCNKAYLPEGKGQVKKRGELKIDIKLFKANESLTIRFL